MCALAIVAIHAKLESTIASNRSDPLFREAEEIRAGNAGQREGARLGDSAWHIRDAVVDHIIDDEGGRIVGCWVTGFNATTLVNGDIDDNRARLHLREERPGDQGRRLRTRN